MWMLRLIMKNDVNVFSNKNNKVFLFNNNKDYVNYLVNNSKYFISTIIKIM